MEDVGRKPFKRTSPSNSRSLVAVMGAAFASVAWEASASTWTRTSAAGPGSWFVSSNWSGNSVPGSGSDADISNGGTAQISFGVANPGNLYLGNASTKSGTLLISGGTLSPNTGSGMKVYVGFSGAGHVIQSAGTFSNTSFGSFYVGYNPDSSGTYELSATGRITTNSNPSEGMPEYIGYSGAGTFLQSGGTNSLARASLNIGENSNSSGYYGLSGGALNSNVGSAGEAIIIGNNGSGRFVQSGGKVSPLGGSCYLGYSSNGTGTYELSGGSLNVSTMSVGYGGSGTFLQSGGQSSVFNELVGPDGTGSGVGRYIQSGGTHSVTFLSVSPQGTFQFQGGTLSTQNLVGKGVFDCTAGTGTISYSGILDFSTMRPLHPGGTSVVGTSTSLMLIDPGFNPAAEFASLSTTGLVHTVGTPLTIPAQNSIAGIGTITDPTTIDGTVSGSIVFANGANISGSGSISSIHVNDTTSGSSGSLQTSNLLIGESGESARFSQTGGVMNIGSLFVGQNSRYSLTTATLNLTNAQVMGTIDFGSASGTMSANGIVNIGHGTIVNASSATVTGTDNSLLIIPARLFTRERIWNHLSQRHHSQRGDNPHHPRRQIDYWIRIHGHCDR